VKPRRLCWDLALSSLVGALAAWSACSRLDGDCWCLEASTLPAVLESVPPPYMASSMSSSSSKSENCTSGQTAVSGCLYHVNIIAHTHGCTAIRPQQLSDIIPTAEVAQLHVSSICTHTGQLPTDHTQHKQRRAPSMCMKALTAILVAASLRLCCLCCFALFCVVSCNLLGHQHQKLLISVLNTFRTPAQSDRRNGPVSKGREGRTHSP